MTAPADPASPPFADVLRRAVVVLSAAALLALPRFTTEAHFDGNPDVPGPVTAMLVGFGLWLAPMLLAASWAAGRRVTMPHPWLAVPALLVLVGGIGSTWAAADKASAMVRAAEMTGVWAAVWALGQALRTDGERRVLLATLVVSGLVAAGVALYQGYYGLEQAWEFYRAHRVEVLARYGIEPGTWEQAWFEDRFRGGVTAALGHPNVLAALLVPAMLVALGFAREKWTEAPGRRARAFAAGSAAAAVVLAWALVLTQSRAGLAAAGLGVWWLAAAWWVKARRRRWALYLAPLVVGAVAAAAGGALEVDALEAPIRTLAYRIDYWRATAAILAERGLAGVGLENFRHHYVEHKLATAPEEVTDPHNLWLAAWATMGAAGIAGAVALVIGAVRDWRRGRSKEEELRLHMAAGGSRRKLLGWVLAPTIVAAPAVLRFFQIGDPSAPIQPAGALVLGGAAVALGVVLGEDPRRLEVADRPMRALRGAAIAAVVAFLVMEQIGTAFLVSATAWVLGATLVASLKTPPEPRARPLPAAGAFPMTVAVMAAALVYLHFLMTPVGRERTLLRVAATAGPVEADLALRAAAKTRPTSWEPEWMRGRVWHREARGLGGAQAGLAYERAAAAYRSALARHPRLRKAHLALVRCALGPEGALANPRALETARAHLEAAARLYPTHVETHLMLGDVLDRLGRPGEALAEYERVLALDALMADERRRLPLSRRRTVEQRLFQLRQAPGAE